jgi:predicted nucleic acid-binding Zn ribbon protein
VTWRPLPEERHREPKRVADGLDALVRRLGGPGAAALAQLFDRWPELVGEAAADHCHPVALSRGTLVVGADEPAWASHLRLGASDLLARVEQLVGAGVAERVEVRVRPRRRGPSRGRW